MGKRQSQSMWPKSKYISDEGLYMQQMVTLLSKSAHMQGFSPFKRGSPTSHSSPREPADSECLSLVIDPIVRSECPQPFIVSEGMPELDHRPKPNFQLRNIQTMPISEQLSYTEVPGQESLNPSTNFENTYSLGMCPGSGMESVPSGMGRSPNNDYWGSDGKYQYLQLPASDATLPNSVPDRKVRKEFEEIRGYDVAPKVEIEQISASKISVSNGNGNSSRKPLGIPALMSDKPSSQEHRTTAQGDIAAEKKLRDKKSAKENAPVVSQEPLGLIGLAEFMFQWGEVLGDVEPVMEYGPKNEDLSQFYGAKQHLKAPASDTPTNNGTLSKNMFEIPGLISNRYSLKEHRVAAMGDTAAKYNFMKEEYAQRRGFAVHREHVRRVEITRSHSVTTTGTVEINFRFRGEKERHPLVFHLLPGCLDDVILGKGFLKLTETFSVLKNFVRRVKQRFHQNLSQLHLLYLGDSAPKFTGLLNGRPREALADSGSNALIMDETFARRMGLPILDDAEHQNTVYFADNTKARTCGITHEVRWEFGLGGSNTEHTLDFHILKNAPADVILSDEFLFKTSAFSEYDCYLIDEDDEDEDADAYFHGIKIDTSYNNVPVPIPEQMSEDARRDAEDDRIDNLSLHEQDAARQQEDERRAAWDARQVTIINKADGSSMQGSTS